MESHDNLENISTSNKTNHDHDQVTLYEFILEGLLLPTVAAFGVVGNLVFITVFSLHRKKIRTFHR